VTKGQEKEETGKKEGRIRKGILKRGLGDKSDVVM